MVNSMHQPQLEHCALTALLLLTACGGTGIAPIAPCVGSCVPYVESATDNILLAVGDTGRVSAKARTADGQPVGIRWSAGNSLAIVDGDGRVIARAPGRSWATATAQSDEMRAIRTIRSVLGRTTQVAGTPAVVFEVRSLSAPTVVNKSLVLTERGKVGKLDLRVRLTGRNANGARIFPSGYYNLFVLMPVTGGRLLGELTGYPVQF